MTPIYHITHLDNLASIIAAKAIWSNAQQIQRGSSSTNIGYSHIKARRLKRPVRDADGNMIAAGGLLGDYVPFNFCSRSVMLYVIYARNSGLTYRDGQAPILHLVSSVETAFALGRPWAFTDIHADLAYANYFHSWELRNNVKWEVMDLRDWRNDDIKKQRQAEFLVHDYFPWEGIDRVGVIGQEIAVAVEKILRGSGHQPAVEVHPEWYY